MNLEYGLIWRDTGALGPGRRFVIWTQGCHRRCFRCASPELQPFGQGIITDTSLLAKEIIAAEGIDGVTISGGEPLVQANAVEDLLIKVHNVRPELTVILFTGYQYEQVKMMKTLKLLSHVDVLIDGEYIDRLNDDKGLRGSSNQRVFHLSSRMMMYKEWFENSKREREMYLVDDNEILSIGISDKN